MRVLLLIGGLTVMGLTIMGCSSKTTQLDFQDTTSVEIIHSDQIITLDINSNNELLEVLDDVEIIDDVAYVSRFKWDYKLRLNTPTASGSTKRIEWLYSSDSGRLVRLTKVRTPLYKINNFERFNRLLNNELIKAGIEE